MGFCRLKMQKIFLRPKFKESYKAETPNLLRSFSNAKYDISGSMRNYILKFVQIASKVREVNMLVTDDLVIHRVLDPYH